MDEGIWRLTIEIRKRVASAAGPFVGRWKIQTLQLVDPLMHEAIEDQQRMLHEAYLQGEEDEIRAHGSAMCRGWRHATLTMSDAGIPDDAYLLLEDISTGKRIAIVGQQNPEPELVQAVAKRIKFAHGEGIGTMTQHEAALILWPAAKAIVEVRQFWPEARISGVREK